MLACRGTVQREGDVIHIIAEQLTDLSDLLSDIAERDQILSLPHGRGDEAKTAGGSSARELKMRELKSRDIYVQDHGGREVLKQPIRDFH
jgi:error-prone DNA polymerase